MNQPIVQLLLGATLVLLAIGCSAKMPAIASSSKPPLSSEEIPITKDSVLPTHVVVTLARPPEPLKSETEVLAIIRTNKLWERKIPPEYKILRDRLPKDDKESFWSFLLKDYEGKLDNIDTNDFQFMDLSSDSSIDFDLNSLSTEEKLWWSAFVRKLKEHGNYMEVAGRMIARLEVLATPESLRTWAMEKIKSDPNQSPDDRLANREKIDLAELPAAIRHLLPEESLTISIIRRDPPSPHVSIMWGFSKAFMGLVIGETNFQYSSRHTYVTNWVSGISAWHSDR